MYAFIHDTAHVKPWHLSLILLLAKMRFTDILWLALSHTSNEDKDGKSSVTPRVLSGSACHLRVVYRISPMSNGRVTISYMGRQSEK